MALNPSLYMRDYFYTTGKYTGTWCPVLFERHCNNDMITENYLKDKYFDESTWSFYFNDDGEVHEISEEVDKIYYQLKQIQWNDALTVLQGEPYNSLVSKVKLLTDKRAIIYYKDETEIKQII